MIITGKAERERLSRLNEKLLAEIHAMHLTAHQG
jgi:hypothetical protein